MNHRGSIGRTMFCGLVITVAPALAAPITWTFTDAFVDGSQEVTGSFVFDSGTSTVLDFNFSVAAGFFVGTPLSFDPSDASN